MSRVTSDCVQCHELPAADAYGWCATCADAYATEPAPSEPVHPLWPPSGMTPAETVRWLFTGRLQAPMPVQAPVPAPGEDAPECPF
jgi:hypothetical protein